MSEKTANVLLVEDSQSLATAYMQYLAKQPYQVTHVITGREALEAIDNQVPNAVLLDLELPDMNGREILEHIRKQAIPAAVIVITAHGSVDVAVEVMRSGAVDFIEKPFSADRLAVTLKNALRRQNLEEFVDMHRRDHFHGFVGSSLSMQTVYHIIDSAAASKATVFITGESGTGKEVCAQAIHEASPRHDKPFVALNCAAIPRDLMESEIFGHTKGAFTGAVTAREGAAARADGGTLFLDEICEMDMDLQSKLLRFIHSSFQKVGSNTLQTVDIRFVCATNRDPMEEVRAGRFREDLYYRLHVIPIELPPLRLREDDVILIARHLLQAYSREENKHFERFAPETESVLRAFDWPGNVRQLQNVIRNIVVLNDHNVVTPTMLPPPLSDLSAATFPPPTAAGSPPGEAVTTAGHINAGAIRPLWQIEKQVIEQTIEHCDGNVPKAAALLDISPSTIYRKRQQWESAAKDA